DHVMTRLDQLPDQPCADGAARADNQYTHVFLLCVAVDSRNDESTSHYFDTSQAHRVTPAGRGALRPLATRATDGHVTSARSLLTVAVELRRSIHRLLTSCRHAPYSRRC